MPIVLATRVVTGPPTWAHQVGPRFAVQIMDPLFQNGIDLNVYFLPTGGPPQSYCGYEIAQRMNLDRLQSRARLGIPVRLTLNIATSDGRRRSVSMDPLEVEIKPEQTDLSSLHANHEFVLSYDVVERFFVCPAMPWATSPVQLTDRVWHNGGFDECWMPPPSLAPQTLTP